MKFGKMLILVGLIAVCILSLNFQVLAGNPPPDGFTVSGPEYWGVVIIACANQEVSLRVKRVVDCQVETDSLIERYPLPICRVPDGQGGERDIIAGDLIDQWLGYDQVIFQEPGVPIVTKVKNFHKKVYSGGSGEYNGDIFSADVQIRFCTNCAPTP
jgi:hypothetical protein